MEYKETLNLPRTEFPMNADLPKSRQMAGFDCPYVPRWDGHGRPIEHQVDKGLKAQEVKGLWVQVDKASGEKCVRCWFTLPTVGQNLRHPKLCGRCSQVLEG